MHHKKILRRILYWYAKLFAKSYLEKFNLLLFHLSLRGLGILNYKDFRISGEQFFVNYIKSNFTLETVFDVGANKGGYSNYFKDLDCRVYSFEPHPKTFESLNNRFSNNQNIVSINIGLSDDTYSKTIFDYKSNDGSSHASLFEEVITEIHEAESISSNIQLSTIDKIVEKYEVDQINLLKIDTEGNELNVLKGAKKTIQHGIIDIIQIEFNEMNIISKSFIKDFIKLLSDYNFYRLLPNGFLEINYSRNAGVGYEIFAFQNIVAIRKSLDQIKLSNKKKS